MFTEPSMNVGVRVSLTSIEPDMTPPADVIQGFLDYYWIRHALSERTLTTWRADLLSLERRLGLAHDRTLVTATAANLRDIFERARGGTLVNELPSLSCIRRFYYYLVAAGIRADDPTESVYVPTPRLLARGDAAARN
jgi:integrase/recombinase XerD